MSYAITTIAAHEACIKQNQDNQQRRIEEQVDLSDCALSNWAGSEMNRFNHMAIRLLKNGIEACGEEKPYDHFLTLVDSNDNVISTKLCSKEFYGKTSYFWSLSPEMAEKFGRAFIPSSKRSRIQKDLGLKETKILCEAKPYAATSCAGIGMPVSFRSVRA